MASVAENQVMWQERCPWEGGGDEWSSAWGSTSTLWHATIFPRIQAFLPAKNILEIAPGFGRCTQYLESQAATLVGVDLTTKCIDACESRFAGKNHLTFEQNDGYSLPMIPDDSVDFVFSWDSLVHAEADVVRSYLLELSKKLHEGGTGFLHHSNLGSFLDAQGRLMISNPHWRGTTMSAKLFRDYCKEASLVCLAQETVAWGGVGLNDCFSLFCKDESRLGTSPLVAENTTFWDEVLSLKSLERFYALEPTANWVEQAFNSARLGDHKEALAHLDRARGDKGAQESEGVQELRALCLKAL